MDGNSLMLMAQHARGSSSEHIVASYLAAQGYELYAPAVTHTRADLVYVKDDKPVRVQVKSSTMSRGSDNRFNYEQSRLANSGRSPYTEADVEEIWIVGTHLWRFPISLCSGRTSLFLGSNNPEPRRIRRTYEPDDFIVIRGSHERPFKDRLFVNE